MEILLTLLSGVLVFAMPLSLIMMLFRSRRKQGVQLFALLTVVGLAVGIVLPLLDEGAVDRVVERQAVAQERKELAEAARLEQLDGFPDMSTKDRAEALGFTRYGAYAVLDDQRVISQYCAYRSRLGQSAKGRSAAIDAEVSAEERIHINVAFD